MSALKKKLLKSCCKTPASITPKLEKKLLSHELGLADILPMIGLLADTEEKRQQAMEALAELMAPEAGSKKKKALESHLRNLTFPESKEKKPELTLVSDAPVATRPFKAKPCSNCPALKEGLCRCALKRARRLG